ncbi:MAG: histidinol dehydrogenase [Gemmatimonadaceae bacterium]
MITNGYNSKEIITECIETITPARKEAVLARNVCSDDTTWTTTVRIIADVRTRGDAALIELALRHDSVNLDSLEVPKSRRRAALNNLDPDLRRSLERSIRNISSVQRAFLPAAVDVSPEPGILVSHRWQPLNRVGVYAPGGRASYPSSVLMGAVPARIAGVGETILCSPPGPAGEPLPAILAAAELAEVDRVFAIGGAGAIAAMAYGTATVPRVDRIVGPGNAYVAAAKLQVSSQVGIDSPAGPSELLVIADATADPDVIAREVMAQAEHDPRAVVVVIGTTQSVAESIARRVSVTLPAQQRRDIIEQALASHAAFLWAKDINQAIGFSNEFAPEHLLLAVHDAISLAPRIRSAGTVFLGQCSSVAFGDYMTGANHVLPTGGLARSYSGLSVLDFIRWTTYQQVDSAAAESLAEDVGIFARAESLPAHAAAALQWAPSAGMRS